MRVSELRVVVLVALWAAAPCALAAPAQVRESTALGIDDRDRVVLRRNVHRLARPEFDQGRSAPSLPMERMILHLFHRSGAGQELSRLLADQQNPASPDYHRWLTPQEFGERFGPTSADLRLAADWLQDRGFRVDEVANGRGWINFSGTAEQVEAAFATEIHDYRVAGVLRHANATDPSIPRGLARVVGGIVSLNSFPRQPQNGGARRIPAEPTPDFNIEGGHYLAPADFATIYNLNPVYGAGYDGTGRTIAIVGRTEIRLAEVRFFRSYFGLPAKDPVFVFNGTHPGIVNPNEEMEADLDVQWAGAVAPGATVKFVISKSTFTSDGVDLSAQYIVDNNLADVMSTSFGQCEATIGAPGLAFYANLWAQAAAQGITSFVASGDSGAAGCNVGGDPVGTGTGVNGLCSTPNNVCVGGSQFDEGSGSYWSGTNDPATQGSALSYIPEIAWNESGSVPGGNDLWSTGGGVSTVHAKPSWQVGPGVPADGKRDVPDVSLSAAIHDAYVVASEDATGTTGLYAVAGTSASSPSFAGLMALVVQRTGQRQGNANPTLYQLGAAQYGGGGVAVFHDVTSGDNSVPGVAGFSAGPGYDLVTGLGTVDGLALVNAFLNLPKLSIGDVTVTEGNASATSAVFQVTLSDTSVASITVHYATANGTATSQSGDYATTSGTLTFTPGQTTKTISVPVNGDTLFELDETFFVNLDSPAGAVIEDGQGKGTILNDDTPPSLSIGNTSVTEGNSGLKNATFVVTLSTVSGAPATVAFATQDGSATAAGGDYVPRSGTLTIAAGQPSGAINIQVKGDAVVESDETFFVNLSSPGNATLAGSQGQGTILNDDSPGQFQFGAAAFTASEALGVATITVRRINGNSAGATVHYSTFDGTGSGAGNQDYTPQSGTLTFGVNQSLATFKVPIAKDSVHEPNETVLLRLDDPQPASLGAALAPQRTAILTIVDNDAGGKIQLAAAAYSVNAAAADGSVKLVVRRIGGLASPAAVHYSFTDGTASAPGDYNNTAGDVIFASSGPGASVQTITVPVFMNGGGAKRFSLSLSAPTGGAVLGTVTTAMVTILGAQPTLGFAGPAFTVKTTQPAALITVKRSPPLTGTVTVHYATSDGSAVAGTDYTPAAGTLTFGPNVAARTFMVAIAKNPFVSGPKDVQLTLSAPTWTLGTPVLDAALGSSLLTIQNPNAVPAVQFSAGIYSVSEPTLKAMITVKRTGDPAGTVTVGYSAGGGTAKNADPSVDPTADYTLAPGTLTFGPNVMVRTFTIPIVNDLVDEGTETAVLSLDTPTWTGTGGAAVLGPLGSATLRITDNEPTVQFAAAAYSVVEAAKSLTIAVRRMGSLASPATVHYDATGGTAVRDIGAGGDYALAAGDLTFGPGQSVKTFVVTLKPDTAADGKRTIDLALTLPSGAQLGTPSTTVVTIRDDDLAGKAQFSAAAYSVAEGAGTATITVTRTGGLASAATVQYSVVAGAVKPAAPADFDPTSGTLTFGPGEKSKPFSVTLHDNGVPDGGAVSLDLTLDTPGGGLALGSPSTATLWIVRE